MSEVLARGAEAIIVREDWDGLDSVVKDRIEKSYRIKELDVKLRKERSKEEAKLISEARRVGVSTPQIYESHGNRIRMEFLDGERAKDVIPRLEEPKRRRLAERIGRNIVRLHERGIVHGDLTTSNMILVDDELYFIDFGLGFFSNSVEDKAVDLYLLLEVLRSTHAEHAEELWEGVQCGYSEVSRRSENVIKRVKEIGSRGRYVSDR